MLEWLKVCVKSSSQRSKFLCKDNDPSWLGFADCRCPGGILEFNKEILGELGLR